MRYLVLAVAAMAVLCTACARDEIEVIRDKAERGDVEAQHFLGSAYTYGKGVPQNYSEAVRWHLLAAEQGHPESQFAVAAGYSNGIEGVMPQDDMETFKWLGRAAQQGHPEAQLALARGYFEGQGVEQDYEVAHKWYLRAAENGNPVAQTVLALQYWDGKGVKKDIVEAYKWITIARFNGSSLELGDEEFEKIALLTVQIWSDLSADQRATGEQLASEWRQTREHQ